MEISAIRIYAEVLEQGLDFKDYILKIDKSIQVINIYTKKGRQEFLETDSFIDRIRKCKDVDVLITAISGNNEYPLLMVEYSTAVPTDDHKMQRSDVYYWAAKFKVPMLKIYPTSKGMKQDFGGGDKFNDEMERSLAYRNGGLFFPIQWETLNNLDTLKTKENALSCIYFSDEIYGLLTNVILKFKKADSFDKYYVDFCNFYKERYKDSINEYDQKKLESFITDSTRFKWTKEKNLITKINRFGHAMDPDRGVLYFTNMLVGCDRCITEIQINRSSNINARGGYAALFDSTARKKELLNYVTKIIQNKQNKFDSTDALWVFSHALNIEGWNLFSNVDDINFVIKDKELDNFLQKSHSMTAKSIFFLSTRLILTDVNRNIICSVSWNKVPIQKFIKGVSTSNFKPLVIEPLNVSDAKEDIITFASVALYKKMLCALIAVSYPGAQGDRCILIGEGRKVLRKYIDIIALKDEHVSATVFLEECKDSFSKSRPDVEKLRTVLRSPKEKEGLRKLVEKVSGKSIDTVSKIKISIGSKYTSEIPNYDVDYIFMFNIDNSQSAKTIIEYSVALIDITLLNIFKPLLNSDKKLKGKLPLDKLYIIK